MWLQHHVPRAVGVGLMGGNNDNTINMQATTTHIYSMEVPYGCPGGGNYFSVFLSFFFLLILLLFFPFFGFIVTSNPGNKGGGEG